MRNLILFGLVLFILSIPVHAGVRDSRHNLGSSNNITGANKFSGTEEVCVFCHTPHGGDTAAIVPLWNRTLEANPDSTYTTYDQLGTSTLDGEVAAVGSVSIACLSCHDGTQAIDSIINEPGSGLDSTSFNAGSWSGDNIDSDGLLDAGVASIGTDLQNDHPIGIQYGGGGIDSNSPLADTTDVNFFTPDFENGANGPVWWIDIDGNGNKDATDVPMFTRSNAYTGQNNPEPFVECATCHDPHSTTNGMFLRASNLGSGLCLACHDK